MDWLSDMSDTSVDRKSLLPSSKFFFPNSIEKENALEDVKESVAGRDTVVLTDPDADGLGAVFAVRQARDNVGFVSCGPHSGRTDVEDGIEAVLENGEPGVSVIVADICPDGTDGLSRLSELTDFSREVLWFDHHDWEENVASFIRDTGTELYLDESGESEDEKCGAQLVQDYLSNSEGFEFSEPVSEALWVTGVYDCWKKVRDDDGKKTPEFIDERAEDLSNACRVLDTEEYLGALEDNGADVLNDESINSKVNSYLKEQDKFLELARERAEIVEIWGDKVAFTYGRGPTNRLSDILENEDDVELLVHVKPSGGVSLRSTESFGMCSTIANNHGGGGHSCAAGCFIAPKNDGDYDRWDTDMLDMASHWTTQGEDAKRVLREDVRYHLTESSYES
jgi:oligoribonuclease NrnB/cAMP/cGMP phosphodiesterase (DHH superfamily)